MRPRCEIRSSRGADAVATMPIMAMMATPLKAALVSVTMLTTAAMVAASKGSLAARRLVRHRVMTGRRRMRARAEAPQL